MNFPGCHSPMEAVQKIIKDRNNPGSPSETMKKTEAVESAPDKDYAAMSWAIDEISKRLNGFDIDLMDQDKRDKFKELPIRNPAEIREWARCWFTEIENLKREGKI